DYCEVEPRFVRELREAAMERFAELDFPTARNEDWKFTNVAPIVRIPFALARLRRDENAELIEELRVRGGTTGPFSGLVFVNGRAYDAKPLPTQNALGVEVTNFAHAFEPSEQFERHLGRYASCEDHAFTALNTS